MALFRSRKSEEAAYVSSPWMPTVDLQSARAAVFALANAPTSSNEQVLSALVEFMRLSDVPTDSQRMLDAAYEAGGSGAIKARPWHWLLAVVRAAADERDDHLVGAGVFWAHLWSSELQRGLARSGASREIFISSIPTDVRSDLFREGSVALERLGDDFIIVGDDSGTIYAGPLRVLVEKEAS